MRTRTLEEINKVLRSRPFINLYRNRAEKYFKTLLDVESLLLSGEKIPEELGEAHIKNGEIVYTRKVRNFGFNLTINISKEIGRDDMDVCVDVMQRDSIDEEPTHTLASISFPYQKKNNCSVVRENDVEIDFYSSRNKSKGKNSFGKENREREINWHTTFENLFQRYQELKIAKKEVTKRIDQEIPEPIIDAYNKLETDIERRQFEAEHPEIKIYIDGMLHIRSCDNAIDGLLRHVSFPHKEGWNCSQQLSVAKNRFFVCSECATEISEQQLGREQFLFLRRGIIRQGFKVTTDKVDNLYLSDQGIQERIEGIRTEYSRKIMKEEYETLRYEALFITGRSFSTLYEEAKDDNSRFALIKAYCRFTGEEDFSIRNHALNEDIQKKLRQMKSQR